MLCAPSIACVYQFNMIVFRAPFDLPRTFSTEWNEDRVTGNAYALFARNAIFFSHGADPSILSLLLCCSGVCKHVPYVYTELSSFASCGKYN